MTSLPNYVEYSYSPPQPFRTLFPQASEDCLDLLQRMFTYDPRQRISAQQALEHRQLLLLHYALHYSSGHNVNTLLPAVSISSLLY